MTMCQRGRTCRIVFRGGGMRSNCGQCSLLSIEVITLFEKLDSLESGELWGCSVPDVEPHKDFFDLRGWRGGGVRDI